TNFGNTKFFKSYTNIVFSNGNYDPWSGGGVTQANIGNSNSIIILNIDAGGHHQDLMFTNVNDQDSVIQARNIELEYIKKWIDQANQNAAIGVCDITNKASNSIMTAFNLLL